MANRGAGATADVLELLGDDRPVLNPARTWEQAKVYAKIAERYLWIELQSSKTIRDSDLTGQGPDGKGGWWATHPERRIDTARYGAISQQKLRELLGADRIPTGDQVENTSCWGVHQVFEELFRPLDGRRAGDVMNVLGEASVIKGVPAEVHELAKRLLAYATKDLDAVWSVE
ncbi:MAG TPA: hypothetical protein VF032_19545 [Thermoleophilaceae bacterium]